MNRLEDLAQSYSQAPWRKQLQVVGIFLLALVLVALVSGIYLSVSARTAAVGRDIQSMQRKIEDLDREIENLQSQLAAIRSSTEMEARAMQMGFEPLQPDQILYLHIPGYIARQPVILAPSEQRALVSAHVLPPQYTESLLTWMKRQIRDQWTQASNQWSGATP
jgi:cell division protein FtsL